MNPIERILHDYPLMLLDGALATELELRGCDLRDPLWSAKTLLESPETIKQVHADYFAAGADCATTASYQATFEGFARRGLSAEEAADLMRRSVRLAAEARDEYWADPGHRAGRPKPLVAASIGSYGAFLADGSEYSGDYGLSERELMEFHRPRMGVLAATEVDLLACETIPSLLEAQALVRLLAEFPSRTAWLSFSCSDSEHISHGERLADCAALLDSYDQIAAIGINCTAPRYIPDLIDAVRSATSKPVLAYPNSGETYFPAQGSWSGERDDACSYAEEARVWYERGARIIGGCCRTTPADIAAIAAWARHEDVSPKDLATLP